MRDHRQNISSAIQALKRSHRCLISTHVNPDPDALCSQLALARLLRSWGVTPILVNEEPCPERFLFFPGSRRIRGADQVKQPRFDTVVLVDCGELSRIGRVAGLIQPDHRVINIDHHVTNKKFGHVNCVVPEASSTAEILYDVFQAARFSWDRTTARLIYTGIMTDTGSFRYDNTSVRTHRIVSELLTFRFSVGPIYTQIYESIPLSDLKEFARIVADIKPLQRGRVVMIELRKAQVKKFSKEFDLRDKIFRYLRAIKGVEVWVILTEMAARRTRVNFRSRSYVNVAKIAERFQGGGHSRASGCVIEAGLKAAEKKVLRSIAEALKGRRE